MVDDRQRRRLRRSIEQNPKNVRFEALSRLLEAYGFELKRSKGSHHSFVGMVANEKVTLVIPFHKPLKAVYVKHVLQVLDEIERHEALEEGDPEDDDQNP